MANCRIKNRAQWSMYGVSSVCQLSCLAYHQEAGGKQHLSVAKNRLEFQKATPGNCFIATLNNCLSSEFHGSDIKMSLNCKFC